MNTLALEQGGRAGLRRGADLPGNLSTHSLVVMVGGDPHGEASRPEGGFAVHHYSKKRGGADGEL